MQTTQTINGLYIATLNEVHAEPEATSLVECVRLIVRELDAYEITVEDLEIEQTSATSWNVIHEGIIGTISFYADPYVAS